MSTGALKLTPAQKLGLQFFYFRSVGKDVRGILTYPRKDVLNNLVNKGLIRCVNWSYHEITAEGLAVAALQGW